MPGVDANKPRILIVDDEEVVLLALTMVLGSEGYEIFTAHDGVEAMDFLLRQTVEVVISDVKMPRANGMEVLRAAKMLDPAPKVILITGYTTEDPTEARLAGADEFIYKAFKRDDILKAVRRVLESGSAERDKTEGVR